MPPYSAFMPSADSEMIGCSFTEAWQGLNIGRIAAQMADFPDETAEATVNRFYSSGFEAITLASLRVMVGWSNVVIGGGRGTVALFEHCD